MRTPVLCGCLLLFSVGIATAQEASVKPSPAAPPVAAPTPQPKPAPRAETAPNATSAPPPGKAPAPPSDPGQAPTADKAPSSPATSAAGAQSPTAAAPATAIQTDEATSEPTKIVLPHDLSPWSMFLSADIIVKVVMVGLAFASLMTWTVFFAKSVEFSLARRRLRGGLARIDGKRFAEAKLALGPQDGVLRGFLDVAERELASSERRMWDSGAKERCDSELAELARSETQAMRRGMPLLATIGSTAPFVGLFGTVWGIMNSFIGISKSQTTNLAVVAPGIAEALLATAIGLVAAIPAVVIYNHFSQSGRRYQHLIAKASGTVQRMLSREFDRRLATTKSAE